MEALGFEGEDVMSNLVHHLLYRYVLNVVIKLHLQKSFDKMKR
jgi:hypothetical protein